MSAAWRLLPLGALLALGCDSHPDDILAAQRAAMVWLDLVDNGQYGESWDSAAAAFKAAVPRPAWEKTMAGGRAPWGAQQTRTLKSASYTRVIPNAPEAEYVVITYSTGFTGKAGVVETVTPMKEKDGTWKVSGYYVR